MISSDGSRGPKSSSAPCWESWNQGRFLNLTCPLTLGRAEVVIQMFDVRKAVVVGFLVFIAWLAASVVASLINGILFAFIPFSGGLALVGTIISFLIFAMLLGVAVVWLLSKFA